MPKNCQMPDSPLQSLEKKIDELIGLCTELNRENRRLKAESSGWQLEKQSLIEKNNLARTKVEATIARLRKLEQGS